MDHITGLVHKSRSETLSISDYGHYRKACSGKLVNLRRKLRIVTPKGRKFEPKKLENLYSNDKDHSREWREYFVFASERAWAHAMHMKSLQASETGEASLPGATRSHVISRLTKASKSAAHLVALAEQAGDLEGQVAAAAYKSSLDGAASFESQKWEGCLSSFSESQVSYTALGNAGKVSTYSDWIADNIEPSLRYAAYQQRLPRTLTLPKIVAKYASRDSDVVKRALEVSSSAISEDGPAETADPNATSPQDLPTTISWRGRTVKLEDARVAQALAGASAAQNEVNDVVCSGQSTRQEKAAAFEKVLAPSQDAVDAAKTAIDELSAEGVAPSDSRMQSLQITRTAVNYDLIGWRIGRNRVLCGGDDGASFEPEAVRRRRNDKEKGSATANGEGTAQERTEGLGRKLARLRERVVLYDSTLQSIQAVRELPGVAADSGLLKKLVSRKAYFSALRCVAIGRSHALQGHSKNALALFARAAQHAAAMDSFDDEEAGAGLQVPRHFLTRQQGKAAQRVIDRLVVRLRALVEMGQVEAEAKKAEQSKAGWAAPLIERLDEYPAGGADLSNLVTYPPKLRPVPVKPIFLDLAWNYIQYPGQARQAVEEEAGQPAAAGDESKAAKRGWFGFGRS